MPRPTNAAIRQRQIDSGRKPTPAALYKRYFGQQGNTHTHYRPGVMSLSDIRKNLQPKAHWVICRLPHHVLHACNLPGHLTKYDVDYISGFPLPDPTIKYGGSAADGSPYHLVSLITNRRYFLRPRRRLANRAGGGGGGGSNAQQTIAPTPPTHQPFRLCLQHTKRFDLASATVPPTMRHPAAALMDLSLANRITGDNGTLGRICEVTNEYLQKLAAENAAIRFAEKLSQVEQDEAELLMMQLEQKQKQQINGNNIQVITIDDSDDD